VGSSIRARATLPPARQGEVMERNWWTRRLTCEPTGEAEAAAAPDLPIGRSAAAAQ
jgi:hypothetical protein